MKITIFISTVLLLNYYNLHAQEYGDRLSPYIDGRGNDLYNEANRTIVNPSLLSKSDRKIAEKHSLRRKTMLLAEANRGFILTSCKQGNSREKQAVHKVMMI